ncbi:MULTISPECIES: twin transmembrane helix small protein [Paracoccus]|uniref:twin transmembrane helix small protein n=1 Tax=Paracoccus TaxID=265 RepID=UPI0003B79936|nr:MULTISPECIES: twin transmembrane helix small protein [Paracoccus]
MDDRNLIIISLVGIGIVFAILMTGIGGFARGGDWNRRNANRMMRWRIYAQAGVIAALLVLVWLGSR